MRMIFFFWWIDYVDNLIKYIIVGNIVVCNEWEELNSSGEAAPEELEEHSMVAHEVQTHSSSRPFHLPVYVALGGASGFHTFDLFRASSTCLEVCWILGTRGRDVPSGCLTSVSFTVEVCACWRMLCAECPGLTDWTCCCMSPSSLHTSKPLGGKNIQYQSSAVCKLPESFWNKKKNKGFPIAYIFLEKKVVFKSLDKNEKLNSHSTISDHIIKLAWCWRILIMFKSSYKKEFLRCFGWNIVEL